MIFQAVNIDVLREHRAELAGQLQQLHDVAGDLALDRRQKGEWNRLTAEIEALDAQIGELQAQRDRAAMVAESRKKWGSLQIGPVQSDPFDGFDVNRESPDMLRVRATDAITRSEALTDQGRTALLEVVGSDRDAAGIVAARANPHYESAFGKIIANPERGLFTLTAQELHAVHQVESVRASMSTSTATAGYLIPLSLDPNVILANSGATNPIRSLATVRQVAGSPHRAITSAGVTGAWVAEGATIGDKSPAFVGTDIDLHKMAMWITGSYEILADAGQDIGSLLPPLLADARDRLEADAFTIGSGSGAPFGIVTDLAAASAFVTCTTRGTFDSGSVLDTLALLNAQTPRTRQSEKTAWVMNNVHLNAVRQQTVGTAGSLLMDLRDDGRLLGHPVFEASAMASVTTSGSYLAVLADMSKYMVCDAVQGPSLEFVPNTFDQATGLPNGGRGWVYWHRTGAKLLDTTAGKILKS